MNTQELLWKFVEDACSKEEKVRLEEMLAKDPELQEELTLIRELHAALTGMEADQPSVRFTRRVMEALPDVYMQGDTEPLVPPLWKKLFWMLVILITGSLFFIPGSGANGKSLPFYDHYLDQLSGLLSQLSGTTVQFFTVTTLSLLTLILLDSLMNRKWHRNSQG